MAAALALGADGAQMGTRMLTAAESPVHDNWKQAVVAAAETDTVNVGREPVAGDAPYVGSTGSSSASSVTRICFGGNGRPSR